MSLQEFTKIIFNIVWSVVGVAIIIIIIVAYQEGSANIYSNFFESAKKAGVIIQPTASQQASNQSQQVTEEQLSCIAKIIGQSKTDGLVSGTTTLTDTEKQAVQPCLASSSGIQQGAATTQNSIPVSSGNSSAISTQSGNTPTLQGP